MIEHASDNRSVHADRRGFAGLERELDLLEERQPCDGRVLGEGVFRERVDVFIGRSVCQLSTCSVSWQRSHGEVARRVGL